MALCPGQVSKTKLCYPTSEDEGDGEEGGHGPAALHAAGAWTASHAAAARKRHPDVSEALDDEGFELVDFEDGAGVISM